MPIQEEEIMQSFILYLSLFLSFNLMASSMNEVDCGFETKENFNQCLNGLNAVASDFGRVQTGCDEIGEKPARPASGAATKRKAITHPLSAKFNEGGADCSAFISTSDPGEYGSLGKVVIEYIREAGENSIYYKNTLAGMGKGGSICPQWSSLTKGEKEHFWVWTFAAIAHDESKCIPSARNASGTNGVAIGLLQLDDKKSNRSWRGPNCKLASVSGARDNIRCGMDIMGVLLLGKNGEYKGSGLIYDKAGRNTSYWEKLKRKGGGGIGDLIKTHPICKAK